MGCVPRLALSGVSSRFLEQQPRRRRSCAYCICAHVCGEHRRCLSSVASEHAYQVPLLDVPPAIDEPHGLPVDGTQRGTFLVYRAAAVLDDPIHLLTAGEPYCAPAADAARRAILDCEVELIFVPIVGTAILSATIRQDPINVPPRANGGLGLISGRVHRGGARLIFASLVNRGNRHGIAARDSPLGVSLPVDQRGKRRDNRR